MTLPIDLAKKYIFIPASKLHNKMKSVNIFKFFNKAADVVFVYSKETALIMLLGDAISIFSSHTEQIKGLKKSDRENKDILIQQEKIERVLDLALSIFPPFMITRMLKKQLESGKITTKDFENILYKYVGPGVGAGRDELAMIDYIRPIKETVIGGLAKISDAICKNPKIKDQTKKYLLKFSEICKGKIEDVDNMYITKSLEEITSFFDDMGDNVSPTIRNMLRNGSAYDEIQGMVNGLCIASVIGYSVIASNIIMPILKNKISKYKTEKELAKIGETKESLKRKKRFAYTETQPLNSNNRIFDTFDNPYVIKEKNIFSEEKFQVQEKRTYSTFETFEKFNQYTAQSTRLRI